MSEKDEKVNEADSSEATIDKVQDEKVNEADSSEAAIATVERMSEFVRKNTSRFELLRRSDFLRTNDAPYGPESALFGWRRFTHVFVYRSLLRIIGKLAATQDAEVAKVSQRLVSLDYVLGSDSNKTWLLCDGQDPIHEDTAMACLVDMSTALDSATAKECRKVISIMSESAEIFEMVEMIVKGAGASDEKNRRDRKLLGGLSWPLGRIAPVQDLRAGGCWFSLHVVLSKMNAVCRRVLIGQVVLLPVHTSRVTLEELQSTTVDTAFLCSRTIRRPKPTHAFQGLAIGYIKLCEQTVIGPIGRSAICMLRILPGSTPRDMAESPVSPVQGLPHVELDSRRNYYMHVPPDTWPVMMIRDPMDGTLIAHGPLDLETARLERPGFVVAGLAGATVVESEDDALEDYADEDDAVKMEAVTQSSGSTSSTTTTTKTCSTDSDRPMSLASTGS